MNLYSIPPLVSSILFFTLGLISLKRKNKINLTFALMCLTTVWWQGCWTVLFNIKDPRIASILVKIGYSGIIFIPITFYHFTIEFLDRPEEKRLVWLSYILGMGFLLSLWTTNLFIRGYYTYFWGFYPKASPILHPVYLVMLSIQALRILHLLFISLKGKGVNPIKRNQIRFMFWAVFFYSFASADFLDNYGLEFYPLGVIAISASFITIAYTIYKYKLLDIHFLIRKILTVLILTVIAGCFIWATYYPRINWITLIIALVIAFLGVMLVPLLRVRTEDMITRILYGEKYNYLNILDNFTDTLPFTPTENDLFEKVVKTLNETMGIKNVAILILDEPSNSYCLRKQKGLDNLGAFRIPGDNNIVSWLKKHREVFIKEEMEKLLCKDELVPIQKILSVLNASLCIPVMLEEDLIGIITLSEKYSGEMYSHIDRRILHRLANQIAVTLDHIRTVALLHRERQQAEITRNRLNAITTMSYGLADRIRNYLVSINLFMDLFSETLKQIEDKLPNNTKETLRTLSINSYGGLKKMLKLSNEITNLCKPLGLELKLYEPKVILDIVNEVMEDLKKEISGKDIKVDKETEGSPPRIYFDRDAIKKVLWHLIQNSIHAIPEGRNGLIHIKITGPIKRDEREFLRIIVGDNGIGIPGENIDSVFNPFFTTKGTSGGLGLGLTICQFLINQHEGIIEIASTQLEKGTIVFVDLPIGTKPLKQTIDYRDILGQFPARRG